VFFHSGEQKRLALETRDHEAAQARGKIYTEILPFSEFYRAEGYHQKYHLRREPLLMKDFTDMYHPDEDFVDSTAAARVNGYIGRYGTCATLRTELNGFGLSPAGNRRLLNIVC